MFQQWFFYITCNSVYIPEVEIREEGEWVESFSGVSLDREVLLRSPSERNQFIYFDIGGSRYRAYKADIEYDIRVATIDDSLLIEQIRITQNRLRKWSFDSKRPAEIGRSIWVKKKGMETRTGEVVSCEEFEYEGDDTIYYTITIKTEKTEAQKQAQWFRFRNIYKEREESYQEEREGLARYEKSLKDLVNKFNKAR